MRVSSSLPVVGRRAAMALAVALTFGVSLAQAQGQQQGQPQGEPTQGQQQGQAGQQAPAKPDPLMIDADQAFIIYVVKSDHVTDFEAAWTQIRQLYATVDDPALKSIGQSFTVLKPALPPPPAGVYYYFYVSQVVKGTSYDPSKVIYYNKPGADATQPATPIMPRADADALYQKLGASIAQLSVVPLQKIGG